MEWFTWLSMRKIKRWMNSINTIQTTFMVNYCIIIITISNHRRFIQINFRRGKIRRTTIAAARKNRHRHRLIWAATRSGTVMVCVHFAALFLFPVCLYHRFCVSFPIAQKIQSEKTKIRKSCTRAHLSLSSICVPFSRTFKTCYFRSVNFNDNVRSVIPFRFHFCLRWIRNP